MTESPDPELSRREAAAAFSAAFIDRGGFDWFDLEYVGSTCRLATVPSALNCPTSCGAFSNEDDLVEIGLGAAVLAIVATQTTFVLRFKLLKAQPKLHTSILANVFFSTARLDSRRTRYS
jgi:hypothetical protein